jgi:hypothetical protein
MSAEGPARRLCATLLRSRRTLGERPTWGRSVSLRGKRPFIALHRACLLTTTGARQAHLDGFDLQANVAVAANNRDGLERLARYVLRPPIAQERLTRTADGRVLLTLKAEWSDGTTHLVFEPIELLEKVAS